MDFKKQSLSKSRRKGDGKKMESVGKTERLAKHISKSCVKLLFLFLREKLLGMLQVNLICFG